MLKLENINFNFDGLSVLKDIDLEVNEQEIVVLIGPSGCGKSTLLKIIAGILEPNNGRVSGNYNNVGFVFQDDRLLPWKSVWDNISLVRDDVNHKEIKDLIGDVGLSGFEKYRPASLSGGMRKRCGIARAFYFKGDLLLMDEPFSGLDFCLRQEMINILMDVWKTRKQSVLFITHELDEALQIASRILVLSKRPSQIVKEIHLPSYEVRKTKTEEMNLIREEIISMIT